MMQKCPNWFSFFLLLLLITISHGIQSFVPSSIRYNVQKGDNITEQMVTKIREAIKQSSTNCTATDRSCFSQVVGLKIEKLYGKSWNIHLLQKTTSTIKGRQYSHDRWITLYNEGDPAFSYYIFKPNDCSKPILLTKAGNKLIENTKDIIEIEDLKDNHNQPQEYWGNSMTDSLKTRVKNIINDAFTNSEVMDTNAEYIQNKMGPGRWEVVIWNTPSFDYMNTCMYASYFGLLVGVQRGNTYWSYYVGRMSLI